MEPACVGSKGVALIPLRVVPEADLVGPPSVVVAFTCTMTTVATVGFETVKLELGGFDADAIVLFLELLSNDFDSMELA